MSAVATAADARRCRDVVLPRGNSNTMIGEKRLLVSPHVNEAERDAAARSVAMAAAAAGNVATGLSAGGFMNLGAAGPLGTAALSANVLGAAPGAAPGG